jgi:hypothetical protein
MVEGPPTTSNSSTRFSSSKSISERNCERLNLSPCQCALKDLLMLEHACHASDEKHKQEINILDERKR